VEVQMARVVARNGLAPEQVRAILAAQATRAQRLAAADDVITNDGPRAALEPLVDALHGRYLVLAGGA
jgi:dephospho-CoA kinase